MGEETKIEWCDSTVNPTDFQCCGCELWNKITRDCYAGRFAERRAGKGAFDKPVVMKPGRMAQAAAWSDLRGIKRPDKPWLDERPRVVFIGDMADTLQPDVPFSYLKSEIIDVVMSDAGRRHVWMWLTKQAKRMVRFQSWLKAHMVVWPDNLWPGVRVTNERTTWRIDELVKIHSGARFISYEPAWGLIDFSRWTCETEITEDGKGTQPSYKIALIITGGQSGSKRMPFSLDWAQHTIDVCEADHVCCFVKQLGASVIGGERFQPGAKYKLNGQLILTHPKGGDWNEWPTRLRVRQFPALGGLV